LMQNYLVLTTYKMLQIPDLRDCQTRMEESTTSMETSPPVMAPIPVPRKRPLSVARPMSPPVTVPRNRPAAHKTTKNQSCFSSACKKRKESVPMTKMKVMTPRQTRRTILLSLVPPLLLGSDDMAALGRNGSMEFFLLGQQTLVPIDRWEAGERDEERRG
jgi:hypothetical protein